MTRPMVFSRGQTSVTATRLEVPTAAVHRPSRHAPGIRVEFRFVNGPLPAKRPAPARVDLVDPIRVTWVAPAHRAARCTNSSRVRWRRRLQSGSTVSASCSYLSVQYGRVDVPFAPISGGGFRESDQLQRLRIKQVEPIAPWKGCCGIDSSPSGGAQHSWTARRFTPGPQFSFSFRYLVRVFSGGPSVP